MRNSIFTIVLVLLTLCFNFGVFLYSYKKLAFPYLHEAQRMENAPLIFSYVIAGFLACSIFSVVLSQFLAKRNA